MLAPSGAVHQGSDELPRLHQAAAAIRKFIESSEPLAAADEADDDDALAPEEGF